MTRYMMAVLCPPYAISAYARKPIRALIATVLIVLAVLTWSTGIGMLLLAFAMIWACREVNSAESDEELIGFTETLNARAEKLRSH